jgi:hypothetical protein
LRSNNEITKQRNNEATNVVSLCRCVVVSLIIILFFGVQNSFASVWDDESIISPPVGSEVLPGGSFEAGDIKGSIIFAKVIPFVIDYAIKAAIVLSVIVLIIGGYRYMTAYGATEKHDAARKTITYAAIGLIISLTAYAIIAIITSIQLT